MYTLNYQSIYIGGKIIVSKLRDLFNKWDIYPGFTLSVCTREYRYITDYRHMKDLSHWDVNYGQPRSKYDNYFTDTETIVDSDILKNGPALNAILWFMPMPNISKARRTRAFPFTHLLSNTP